MHDDVFNCVCCKRDTTTAEAHDLITTYCVSCAFELRKKSEPLGEAVCFSCWLEIKMQGERCSNWGNPIEAMLKG